MGYRNHHLPTDLITGAPHTTQPINRFSDHMDGYRPEYINISNVNLDLPGEFCIREGELYLEKYNNPCDRFAYDPQCIRTHREFFNPCVSGDQLSVMEYDKEKDKIEYLVLIVDDYLIHSLSLYFEKNPGVMLSIDYMRVWDEWVNGLNKKELLLNSKHPFEYVAQKCLRKFSGKEKN